MSFEMSDVYPNNGEYTNVQQLYYSLVEAAYEAPADVNIFREALATYGANDISNTMDAGRHDRTFVQLLALRIGERELPKIKAASDNRVIHWNDKVISRITSIYDLAHFFANVATNQMKKSQVDWEKKILKFHQFGIENIPNESPGYLSPESVELVGGIRTWELIRDLVFEYYLFEPNRNISEVID